MATSAVERSREYTAPWIDGPKGVVSPEELLAYAADVFCALSDVIGRVVGLPLLVVGHVIRSDEYRREISIRLKSVKDQCIHHGWKETASRILEVEDYINQDRILPAVLQSKMADLQSHLYRLLQQQLFFHVEKEKSEEYFAWMKRTKEWREGFPRAYFELCSSAECYLVGRSVACVFHSMRALEIALQMFAKELGVLFEREQWENLINNIEVAIKKINGPSAGADWKKKRELYSEAALHFRYLKNAWRNHVMHVRHEYDDEAARKIWEHASDFISDLSLRVGLKET